MPDSSIQTIESNNSVNPLKSLVVQQGTPPRARPILSRLQHPFEKRKQRYSNAPFPLPFHSDHRHSGPLFEASFLPPRVPLNAIFPDEDPRDFTRMRAEKGVPPRVTARPGKRTKPPGRRWRKTNACFDRSPKRTFEGGPLRVETVANQEANRSINTTGVEDHSVTTIFFFFSFFFSLVFIC